MSMMQDQQLRLDQLIIGSDPLEQQQHHHHFQGVNTIRSQYENNFEEQEAAKNNGKNYNEQQNPLYDQPVNYDLAMSLFQEINTEDMDGNSMAMVRALEERLQIIAMLDQHEIEIKKKLNESTALKKKMEQHRYKQSIQQNKVGSPSKQQHGGGGIIENKSLVTSYVFQNVGTSQNFQELKQSKQLAQSTLMSVSNYNRKKETPLNMSAREQMKCTFHPEINKRSEKMAKRNPGDGNYSVKYLYQDFLARKEKEKEKIERENQEVKKAMGKCKIDTNSEKIVLKKIDKVFTFLINSIQEGDTISYENLGVLFQQIGLFRALEFQKNQDQTSLFLDGKKKLDIVRLQAEMKFHEQAFRIMRISSVEGISKKVAFDTIMVMMEKKIPLVQCEVIISDILFNSLGIDASNIELEGRQAILQQYLEQSKLPEKSVSENENWDVTLLITNFRKLHDDKTNLMEWYGSKLNNLLGDTGMKSTLKKNDGKTNTDLKFHPTINKKSKQLDSFIQRGASSLGSQTKGQLQMNQDSFTAELNLQDEHQRLSQIKSEKSRFEKLYDHSKYLQEKKIQQKEHLVKDELNSYSFRPALNPKSVAMHKASIQQATALIENGANVQERGTSPTSGIDFALRKSVYEKLYEKHQVASEIKDEVRQQVAQQREKQELKECSFRPQINAFAPPIGRLEEGDSLVSNIKGVQQQLERLQKARVVQQEKESFFERQRLALSQNASRFTESMPFSFDQNNKNNFSALVQSNPKKEREIIGNVDVNFSKGKKGRIIIYKGDQPDELALNFAKIYSLNDEMRFTLRDMLSNYILKIEQENLQTTEQAIDEENNFTNRSEKAETEDHARQIQDIESLDEYQRQQGQQEENGRSNVEDEVPIDEAEAVQEIAAVVVKTEGEEQHDNQNQE